MSYVINRPDPAAMGRLLDGHPCSALGAVLRLAWLEGLSREEIVGLTWPDLSMESREIRLKDRSVPFFGDMEDCLRERMRLHGRTSPHVVISEKFQQPLNPISVSRMVRRALDGAGMETVRLMDLRHDFVIRQLETTDWAAVARMSGLAVSMFQTVYAGYVQVRNPAKAPADGDNEYRIWRILQSEKGSTVGLALALRWYMDIQLNEMAALTWAQVDFAGNRLQLESRAVELAQSVRDLLLREYGRREAGDDPHVLLTEHSRKPMDTGYLSKSIRTVLIRGGVEHITFRDLRSGSEKTIEKVKILTLAKEKRGFVRRDVTEKTGLTDAAAYSRLKELVRERELVRVSSKYYLTGTVIPPEEQEAAIYGYLREHGTADSGEIHHLLGLERRQSLRILKKMVAEGTLIQKKQRFSLPPESAETGRA